MTGCATKELKNKGEIYPNRNICEYLWVGHTVKIQLATGLPSMKEILYAINTHDIHEIMTVKS